MSRRECTHTHTHKFNSNIPWHHAEDSMCSRSFKGYSKAEESASLFEAQHSNQVEKASVKHIPDMSSPTPKNCRIELFWPTPYISFLLMFHFSHMRWWKEAGWEIRRPAWASALCYVSGRTTSNEYFLNEEMNEPFWTLISFLRKMKISTSSTWKIVFKWDNVCESSS